MRVKGAHKKKKQEMTRQGKARQDRPPSQDKKYSQDRKTHVTYLLSSQEKNGDGNGVAFHLFGRMEGDVPDSIVRKSAQHAGSLELSEIIVKRFLAQPSWELVRPRRASPETNSLPIDVKLFVPSEDDAVRFIHRITWRIAVGTPQCLIQIILILPDSTRHLMV
jgi:hypothetical protein